MRILQIRLQNLNALAGRWLVDLSGDAYINEGLFAITGPTGAGKSTLLDAICLALYGQTPRLDKITKGSNDVMARHTGECFAEVTFETPAGRWRCHWSQRRAHRKPDGELQAPRHELSSADDGRILASSVRDVAAEVERLTGLDYERFTRAMLLSQGAFDAFLNAPPDKRAPLLEQLTGTALYSHISMRVHERHSQEQHTLAELQAQLHHFAPLDEAQRHALEAQRAAHARAAAELEQQRAAGERALQWGQNLLQLHERQARLAQTRHALDADVAAFAPRQTQLAAALRALELAAQHSALAALRQAQQNDAAAAERLHHQRPAREAALAQAQSQADAAQRQHHSARQQWQQAQPALRQARALDVQIRDKRHALDEAAASAQASAQREHTQRATLEQQHTQHAQAQAALAQAQADLQRTQSDADLISAWPELRPRLQDAAQAQRAAQERQQHIQQARHALEQHAQTLQASQQQAAAQQAHAQQLQTQWTQQQAALAQWLHHRPLADWRADLTTAQRHADAWREAIALHQTWLAAEQAHAEAQTQRQHLQTALTSARHARELAALHTQTQKAALEQRERQWQLELHIQNLEELRHTLSPGQPCPLCGAEQHPYAAHRPDIAPEGTRQAIDQARQQLEHWREQATQAQLEEARLSEADAHARAQIQSQQQALQAAQTQWEALFAQALPDSLPPEPLGPSATLADWLAQAQDRQAQHLRQCSERLAQADTLQAALAPLRAELDAALAAAHQAERDALTQAQQHSQAQARLHALQEAAQAPDAHWQQQSQTLLEQVRRFAPKAQLADVQAPQPLLAQLGQRHAQRQRQEQQAADARQQLQDSAQRLALHQQELAHLQAQTARHAAEETTARQSWQTLVDERQRLLEGQAADACEAALLARMQQTEAASAAARQDWQAAQQALEQLHQRQQDLAQALAERAPRLQDGETALAQRLHAQGFASEAEWHAACLPEHERHHLGQQAQALAQRQALWEQQQRDTAAQLAALQSQPNPVYAQWQQAANACAQPAQAETTPLGAEDPGVQADSGQADLGDAISPRTAVPAPAPLPWDAPQWAAALEILRALQQQRSDAQAKLAQAQGALQQRLDDDSRLRQRHAAQLAHIQRQQRQCQRWALLHQLIGSADGKKYRNFVQGLGFEAVIAHANVQLQRMTDRYLLVRDTAQPLALNVMDHYQGGEIRTTKNLSGGESFLVSLALALGLSHMASRNVRVDSLFLDEGFGTLDEQTLDVALDALGTLQRSGKLIGVISHVAALKDRIATQIEVTPQSGGRSALQGPGVQRLSDAKAPRSTGKLPIKKKSKKPV
ncbi:hypothetical protein EBQ26_07985 [Allofranklinella schreckenbergeri]|uniref:Rad50/SbcC-type AAA domain-containing protein n=1 Tax=Allofranklinella schreckenbergeri TaxID=1076744 RepID=A0A3M6Q309_9BURK|nr:AAA family ATPase [Allofranklinella schreckenbergeri]RMW97597.1 hypothetical protein EBQ26_07985 [Allofranklinella schreckenbergeri]